MALTFTDPTNFKTNVDSFITRIKTKKDYFKTWIDQPFAKSTKTPGDEIFNPSVFKAAKNRLNLSHYSEVLRNPNLSEQERKFYNLEKFMLETADADYSEVSDIATLFRKNASHINELLAIKKNSKDNKLIFLVPTSQMGKSNFWLSLFFIELTKGILVPDYYINSMGLLDNYQFSTHFSSLYNYIVVITDDISYSGQQLGDNTFKNKRIHDSVTVFFNLAGYSEIAHKRITGEKTASGSNCNIEFGKGSKTPLNKLSARFHDAKVENNVLLLKSKIDFVTPYTNIGVRMLSSLILNDVFYLSRLQTNHNSLVFVSNLFSLYDHYETKEKVANNNGSIQYLPIKYPDSYSTVENMCVFKRIQNVVIVRIDRLINHLNLPGLSNEQKLDYLSQKIISKK